MSATPSPGGPAHLCPRARRAPGGSDPGRRRRPGVGRAVGAAGLGRLLQENLAVFRFPVVTTVLVATLALSIGTEVLGRRVRAAMRA